MRYLLLSLSLSLSLSHSLTHNHAHARSEREDRAFKPKFGVAPGGITVAAPFKLATADRCKPEREQLLRERVERERMRDCTFEPQTLESINRKTVAALVREEDTI